MKINLRSMSRLENSEPEHLVTRLSGARTAQFGAGALGVLLLAGSFLGGAAGHAGLAKSSSETWLEDGPRGELVEIDTASGQAQQRLSVAPAGDVLEVHQRDNDLLVQDRTTGTLRTIDLTTLLAEGERQVTPGTDTVVILDGPRVAVAELDTGVIQGIDPISSASIGSPFSVGGALTAAVSDNSGHVWGLSTSGRLVELVWGGSGYKLRDSIQVKGVGAGSGLSAHDSGVTVMVTPTGSVEDATDDGTGTTNVRAASGLGSPVLVGPSTPPGVVPAASPDSSVVVIATPTGVVQPDVAAEGCPHPLAPVVFENRVYVPCKGSPVVVVLNADGTPAGPPITVPVTKAPPELSVTNGTLVVNVPGSTSVVLVNPKGGTTAVGTEPPGIPTTSQSDPVPMPTPSTPPASSKPKPSPSHPASQPSKSAAATPTVGISLSPGRPRDGAIAVGVNWSVTNAGEGSKFLVTVAVDGGTSQTLQVGGNKRSAVITLACPTSCSGTATVALMSSGSANPQASKSWTSVAPSPVTGSVPSPGATPSGGLPTSGDGGPGTSGSGGGPVIGPSSSASPILGGSGAPIGPGPTASATPVLTPTVSAAPPVASPTADPTPKAGPTADPIRPTPPPVEPTTPVARPTTPVARPTTPVAQPTAAATTPAAPPPTTASPAGPANPQAGETLIANVSETDTARTRASIKLTIDEPADWAAYNATCTVFANGSATSLTFTCDSTSTITETTTATYDTDYEYTIQIALRDGGTVTSASYDNYTNDPPDPPCTGTACRCGQTAQDQPLMSSAAFGVEPAVEPAVAGRQDSDMPNVTPIQCP